MYYVRGPSCFFFWAANCRNFSNMLSCFWGKGRECIDCASLFLNWYRRIPTFQLIFLRCSKYHYVHSIIQCSKGQNHGMRSALQPCTAFNMRWGTVPSLWYLTKPMPLTVPAGCLVISCTQIFQKISLSVEISILFGIKTIAFYKWLVQESRCCKPVSSIWTF